jgi:hypothetical protein
MAFMFKYDRIIRRITVLVELFAQAAVALRRAVMYSAPIQGVLRLASLTSPASSNSLTLIT